MAYRWRQGRMLIRSTLHRSAADSSQGKIWCFPTDGAPAGPALPACFLYSCRCPSDAYQHMQILGYLQLLLLSPLPLSFRFPAPSFVPSFVYLFADVSQLCFVHLGSLACIAFRSFDARPGWQGHHVWRGGVRPICLLAAVPVRHVGARHRSRLVELGRLGPLHAQGSSRPFGASRACQ